MKKTKFITIFTTLLLVLTMVITPIFTSTYTKAAKPVNLYVDAGKKVNPFNPEMLGSNVGIWTNGIYFPKANPKLVNLVKEAGMKMLRYPAGAEADDTYFDRNNQYEWHTGPKPYSRTMRADHLDAFIALCKETGAEPLIVVNARIDNPDMAADIVRYCNIERGYNVKYFEIGNEPEYWHEEAVSVYTYADRVVAYADAMKKVDSKIQISNGGPAQPVNIPTWLEPVVKRAGKKLDGINIHWYPLWEGQTDKNHPQHPSVDHLLTYNYETINEWHQIGSVYYANRFVALNKNSLVNLRNTYSPNAKIGLTELSPVAGGDSKSGVSDTLGNALWFGDVLGRLAYNGVDYVTQFLLLSDPQKYAMTDNGYKPRPMWYAYVMYHRYFGDMMVQSSTDDNENLTIWSSTKTGQDDKLYVMVINRNKSENIEATLNFENFGPLSEALAWELNSTAVSSLNATINGVKADSDVNLPEIEGKKVANVKPNFTYTYPAHSITTFEFTKDQNFVPSPTPVPTKKPTTTPKTAANKELLVNPGFEAGVKGWKAVGGAKLTKINAKTKNGKYGVSITNRKMNTDALTQDITSVLKKNGKGKYDVSAFVQLAKGSDTGKVVIRVVTNTGTKNYEIKGNVSSKKYTKIAKQMNINWSGTLKSATLSIYTNKSKENFNVNDCSMKFSSK